MTRFIAEASGLDDIHCRFQPLVIVLCEYGAAAISAREWNGISEMRASLSIIISVSSPKSSMPLNASIKKPVATYGHSMIFCDAHATADYAQAYTCLLWYFLITINAVNTHTEPQWRHLFALLLIKVWHATRWLAMAVYFLLPSYSDSASGSRNRLDKLIW